MKFPIFTSFIIFVLVTQFVLRRSNRREHEADDEFWERERLANSSRKKPMDDLSFISIPLEKLPFGAAEDDVEASAQEQVIRALSADENGEWSRIVNLTGISNTDLKLRYGAANLERLIYYDQNFTSLVTSLQAWGNALMRLGLYREAETVLSYAVSIGTDVTSTYSDLIELYSEHLGLSDAERHERIAALLPTAEALQSLSRDKVVSLIRERL